jgi:hypothetical protein
MNGSVSVVEKAIEDYFYEFALKTAEEIVNGYLERLK